MSRVDVVVEARGYGRCGEDGEQRAEAAKLDAAIAANLKELGYGG